MKKFTYRNKITVCLLVISGLIAASASSADEDTVNGELVALCTSCHGVNGISMGPATPTIGGLSRNYLVGAMLAYKFAQDISQADDLIDADQQMEDVVVLERPTGIMNTIAELLSVNEIKELADYLSQQTPSSPVQNVDSSMSATGADLHNRYCEKCHENGGASSMDDVGILAGRWKRYLTYLFEDIAAGRRQMPKKMSTKFDAIKNDHGDAGLQQLINYYAGQQVIRDGS
jgi:sulfide dehydrogenase cytochrome subunit